MYFTTIKQIFSSYLWLNKSGSWDFPGGKTPPSSAGGPGPISGQGTKIPRAATREPACTSEEPAQSDKQTNNSGSHLQAVDSGELSTARAGRRELDEVHTEWREPEQGEGSNHLSSSFQSLAA